MVGAYIEGFGGVNERKREGECWDGKKGGNQKIGDRRDMIVWIEASWRGENKTEQKS